MSLPKSSFTTFEFSIPSIKKSKIKFRPMKVKEEKILLTAKESKDTADILSAIKQVLVNCKQTENVDIEQLAIFDIEYLFLRLRAISVDNISKVSYKDGEDGKVYDFDIDLNTIEVNIGDTPLTETLKVSETLSLQLGYPTAALYSDSKLFGLAQEQLLDFLVSKCIKTVYDGDNQYDLKNFTEEEVEAFIDDLDIKTYDKIKEFFSKMPTMEHIIKYKNSLGNDRTIRLATLDDFFILG